MKKLLILLILWHTNYNAQIIIYDYCFDQFENCADYDMSDPEPIFTIDVGSNANNIWQIGPPQKSILNSAWSLPKVIITDTIYTYGINDTSSFTIEGTAIESSSTVNWSNVFIEFNYFVDSDTLSDFGLIEFSPDNGTTWIDLINDPSYASYLEWAVSGIVGIKPVLSGTSGNWMNASLNMQPLVDYLNIQSGTVFLWRFTFISDSIQNNRDGLMFDNIYIEITPPIGLQENELIQNRKVLKIVDGMGREVESKANFIQFIIFEDGTTEKRFIIE